MSAVIRGGNDVLVSQFERFVLFLAASFTCYRLLFAVVGDNSSPIPDEILLAVLLAVVGYLWATQLRALSRLVKSEAALRDMQTGVLAALVQAVEAKDIYTRGHSEQVRRLSVELAKKMKLDEDRVQVIGRAAVLHDLGKIETPDALLHKTTPLSNEEWEILRLHPSRTASILSSLEFLQEETRIAAFHHERCDGSGYSVGLKADAIPIESSIIAISDAFDAMNSNRPYRSRLPREKILEELTKGRDVQHPSAVVDAFIGLLKEKPELWIRTHADAAASTFGVDLAKQLVQREEEAGRKQNPG